MPYFKYVSEIDWKMELSLTAEDRVEWQGLIIVLNLWDPLPKS